MIGENILVLNYETVCEAVEVYINNHLSPVSNFITVTGMERDRRPKMYKVSVVNKRDAETEVPAEGTGVTKLEEVVINGEHYVANFTDQGYIILTPGCYRALLAAAPKVQVLPSEISQGWTAPGGGNGDEQS